MNSESLQDEVQKWVRQAEHDLEMAEKNIALEGYDTSATLSQQATEKFLKACFIHKFQKRAPKTHFLEDLIEEIGLPQLLKDHARVLSSDYTASRYPDILGIAPVDAYDKEDALDRLQKAKEMIAWCRTQLP